MNWVAVRSIHIASWNAQHDKDGSDKCPISNHFNFPGMSEENTQLFKSKCGLLMATG